MNFFITGNAQKEGEQNPPHQKHTHTHTTKKIIIIRV